MRRDLTLLFHCILMFVRFFSLPQLLLTDYSHAIYLSRAYSDEGI